ncbi:MAG: site-specific integrase [Treponema sp.]|nr:site-specific integrase [Treponema sp.]
MKLPFIVFKRADRPYYLVKFKNNQTGDYLSPISTKKTTEAEAVQVAFEWLKDGIPRKNETISFKKYSLRDLTKEADLNNDDANYICKELQRRGILKSFVLLESSQAIDFIKYLEEFWSWDISPYIKERLRKRHSIHKRYTIEQAGVIQKYWIPFFAEKNKSLGEITRKDIEGFITNLETLEERAIEEQAKIDKALEEEALKEEAEIAAGLRKPKRKNAASKKRQIIRYPKSAKRLNTIIQAGTVALSWAFNKELIDRDVTAGITWFSGKSKERLILTPELATAIFRVQWIEKRSYIAAILGLVTSLRAGELQGLQVKHLGKDCLYIQNSWNFQDGLKTTKNNESRIVEVPFPGLMQKLIELAKSNPHDYSMESYIFWAEKSPNKPMEQDIFLRDLRSALVKCGMSKETAKKYTFHGFRHFYTSYMHNIMKDERLLKSQTGHLDSSMIRHYSNHCIAGDRENIQHAQIECFGRLLPDFSGTICGKEI